MANSDHANRPAGREIPSPYSPDDAAIERRVRARVRRQLAEAEGGGGGGTLPGGTRALAAAFTAAALAAVFAVDTDQNPATGEAGDDATPVGDPGAKGTVASAEEGSEQIALADHAGAVTGAEDATWFAGPAGFDRLLWSGPDIDWALIPDDRAAQRGSAMPPPPTPGAQGEAGLAAAVPATAEADPSASMASADHPGGADSAAHPAWSGDSGILGSDLLALQGAAEAAGTSFLSSGHGDGAEARGGMAGGDLALATADPVGGGGTGAVQAAAGSGGGAVQAVAGGGHDDAGVVLAAHTGGGQEDAVARAALGGRSDDAPSTTGHADPPGGGNNGLGHDVAVDAAGGADDHPGLALGVAMRGEDATHAPSNGADDHPGLALGVAMRGEDATHAPSNGADDHPGLALGVAMRTATVGTDAAQGSPNGADGHPGQGLGLLLAQATAGGDGGGDGGSTAQQGKGLALGLGQAGRGGTATTDVLLSAHQPPGHDDAGPGLADAIAASAPAVVGPAEDHGGLPGHGLGGAHHALAGNEVVIL